MVNKVIAFDFDGTLCNSFKLLDEAFKYTLSFYGIDYTRELFSKNSGPTEEGILINILGEEKGKEAFKKYYLLKYKELHDEYLNTLYLGMEDILKYLKSKNIKMVVVTGRSEETLNISLRKLKLNKYFKDYYFGSISGVNKPINFMKVLKKYKLNNESLLYIGDSTKDIESASKAHIQIISVNFENDIRKNKLNLLNPNKVATNKEELLRYIDEFLKK